MSRGGKIFLFVFAATLLVVPIFLFAVRQQKADETLVNAMSEVVNVQREAVVVKEVAVDADEDGYAVPRDCDDTNGEIHPDATENLVDEIDNDCNGKVDDGEGVAPVLLNVVTPKIIDVGTTAIEVSFNFTDPDRDITEVMFETTEFFYKTGAMNFYNSDFRPWADVENMECVSGVQGSCVINAQFVGGLGWRDVFSARLQLRDSKGHESKMVPFQVTIGTQQ